MAVADFYKQRGLDFRARAAKAEQNVRRLANARLLVFAVAVVELFVTRNSPVLFWLIAAFAAVLFSGLVISHRRARAGLRRLRAHIDLADYGAARVRREWGALEIVSPGPAPAGHPYADDLNLFGAPAVNQLLGPVHTLHGHRSLRDWLLEGAAPSVIKERQDAVRVLAPLIDFRDDLAITALHNVAGGHQRADHFTRWLAAPAAAPVTRATIWFARSLPLATVLLIFAQGTGVAARAWWLIPLTMSAVFCAFYLRRCYAAFDAAFSRDPATLSYAPVFAVAEEAPPGAPLLDRIRDQLHASDGRASQRIRRLERIMLWADMRLAGSLSLILEVFFLWSFHCWVALLEWREENAERLPAWLAAAGELEVLCSIATLQHDHPDWCLPQIEDDAPGIDAKQLGHPMLAEATRVDNDVHIGPPGSFLFVTGSNMSGKSTLLRAIGVNTVLAQAGAPVCAAQYRARPVRLFTYINVRDSIADGVSLYLAQLQRIKTIIDAAETRSERVCCYLLDEILSGTNSTDRTIAVRAVVHRLLALPAIGALATHDLALAADPTIQAAGQSIHFRETIDPASGAMSFDYRIRAGAVQSSNAIELLRLMGLQAAPAPTDWPAV